MLRTLVVGLGHAGAGLHVPVLAGLRETVPEPLFAREPIVGCDLRPDDCLRPPGVVVAGSVEQAARQVDPATTVVHVCTPPTGRLRVLIRLVTLGFRRFVVEKPLAGSTAELDGILALRDHWDLEIVVVAHWLAAALTDRLAEVVASGRFGGLRRVAVAQHKPRFTRSLCGSGHPTAFDVELPHSLGLVLALAGPAELVDAGWTPMSGTGRPIPRLGSARMTLAHHNGVRSALHSDLMSPVRERRVTLRLDDAVVTGSFPLAADDHHAQLRVVGPGVDEHSVFVDDALRAFLLAAYRHFAGTPDPALTDLRPHAEVVRLLRAAKQHCTAKERREVPAHA